MWALFFFITFLTPARAESARPAGSTDPFAECPDLRGRYRDGDGSTVEMQQFQEDRFLVYRARYSSGAVLDIKVGSVDVYGQSRTDTYCSKNKVLIRFFASGVVSWNQKNETYPSDSTNEAEIINLIADAKKARQNLAFQHEVIYRTGLEGDVFETTEDSTLYFQNQETQKFDHFEEQSFTRMKKIQDP